MAQGVIDEHQSQHRLGDRRCTDADAGVVTTVRFDRGGLPGPVDRPARQTDARGWFDRHAHRDLLPGRNAAEHTASVVGKKALRRHLVAVLAAFLGNAAETGAMTSQAWALRV